ncbi:MAG: 2-oxoacid:acceptor oxidoreductase family protein [Gammaproteobacteria bacterium]|nr:2-oxoacid:acceptor oxidoreductase family protein [Gammaproteobacteria bacterium]
MTARARDWQIRLAGTGGQGLGLAGRLLADAFVAEGLRVAQSQTYEPTSRGGTSRSDLVAASAQVDYPLVTRLDCYLLLDQAALEDADALLVDDALVIIDADRVPRPPTGRYRLHALTPLAAARALGNPRVANVIGLGALVALSGVCAYDTLETVVAQSTPSKFRALNLAALREGRRLATGVHD